MTLAVRGAASQIVVELRKLLPMPEDVLEVPRGHTPPITADKYLFCQGLLRPKRAADQTEDEISEGFDVNASQIMKACDVILAGNANARICVIGSESGFSGSFDETYAAAKARLHSYVEHRQLRHPWQQLVCVAPGIIIDSRMTQCRDDLEQLEQRRMAHPKRRWLTAMEVAKAVHFALYVDRGFLTNTVVRLNGGEHLWR